MVNYSKRLIIVRGADLGDFSLIFVGKMCVFVSRPMKIVTFLLKNGETPKRVVDFLLERGTFRNKILEIDEDFACEAKFLHFSHCSSFFIFFSFFQFFLFFFISFVSLIFFISFISSLSFFIFSFFLFFLFLLCSFSFLFFSKNPILLLQDF